jgi:hypothetical protein
MAMGCINGKTRLGQSVPKSRERDNQQGGFVLAFHATAELEFLIEETRSQHS